MDPDYPLRREVLRRLYRALAPGPGLRCLDIGAGSSSLPKELAGAGCEVVTVDVREPDQTNGRVTHIASAFPSDLVTGKFDRVSFSLVSMFVSPDGLRRVWHRITEILEPGGWAVAVDLHPTGRVDALPWRKRDQIAGYWGEEEERGTVQCGSTASELGYRFYRLDVLLNIPADAGLRLSCVEEFPEAWQGEQLRVPAYLLTVWEKADVIQETRGVVGRKRKG